MTRGRVCVRSFVHSSSAARRPVASTRVVRGGCRRAPPSLYVVSARPPTVSRRAPRARCVHRPCRPVFLSSCGTRTRQGRKNNPDRSELGGSSARTVVRVRAYEAAFRGSVADKPGAKEDVEARRALDAPRCPSGPLWARPVGRARCAMPTPRGGAQAPHQYHRRHRRCATKGMARANAAWRADADAVTSGPPGACVNVVAGSRPARTLPAGMSTVVPRASPEGRAKYFR